MQQDKDTELTNLTQTTTATSAPVIKSFDLPADIRHRIASAFIERDLNAAMAALDDAEIIVESFSSTEHADAIDNFPTLKQTPIRITSASGLNAHGTADMMIATPDAIGAAEALELLFRVMLSGERITDGHTITVLRQNGETLDLIALSDVSPLDGSATMILAFHPGVGLHRTVSTTLH